MLVRTRWIFSGWTRTSVWTPQFGQCFRDSVFESSRPRCKGRCSGHFSASQLFGAMPPLESLRIFVPLMISVGWSRRGRRLRMRHNEISRVHFMETAQRLIYVKFPTEDRQVHGEDKLG